MPAFLVLNTDASKPRENDSSSETAIGVVLRQRRRARDPLKVIDYISEMIDPVPIQEAEYRALIEGLKLASAHNPTLASAHNPTDLHVYVDSESVVKQVNAKARVRANMKPLHAQVLDLIDRLEDDRIRVSISWVPRDINLEADQRAADAFLELDGRGRRSTAGSK